MRVLLFLCLLVLCLPGPKVAVAYAGESEEPSVRWELLNPPPGRSMHGAVWDPIGNRMLVFGGLGGANLGDLWAFDPATNRWEELFPEGERPPRLIAHTAVWDTVQNRMLVFGGFARTGGRFWAYHPDQNRWEPVVVEGPSPGPRGYHSAAWDPVHGRMYVVSGIGPQIEIYDDIWVYDSAENAWAELPRSRPRPFPRFFHAAAWDPRGEEMLLFGGGDMIYGEWFNDLWGYRPSTSTWREISTGADGPSERLSHNAAWDSDAGRLLVFGGGCGPGCYNDDLWSYTLATRAWEQLAAPDGRPGPRGGQSAAWDAVEKRLLVFGGATTSGPSNEVWTFLPSTGAWLPLSPSTSGTPVDAGTGAPSVPAVRQSHGAAWDAATATLLLFGGYAEGDRYFDDIWGFSPGTQEWYPVDSATPGPPARSSYGAAWDSSARSLYLFGGFNPDGYSDELWTYDVESGVWAQHETDSTPLGREDPGLAWTGDRLLLFGGTRGQGGLDDLWAYGPTGQGWTWTTVGSLADGGVDRPAGRYRHSAVWDASNARLLVFGGYGGAEVGRYLDDLWSYEPSTGRWQQLAQEGPRPSARAWHRAVWDEVRGRLVIIGGFSGGVDYLDDAWEYDAEADAWIEMEVGEPQPTARAQHVAVWADDAILLHGGNFTNEVWRLTRQ